MIKLHGGLQSRRMSSKLAGFLASALIFATITGCSPTKQATTVKPPAIAVKTEQIHLSQLPSSDSFLGSVTPYMQTSLSPATAGTLNVVNVRAGDIVQPGQVLAKMDDTKLQTAVLQQQANLTSAQARLQTLKDGVQSTLAKAQQSVANSQQSLTTAQQNVDPSYLANQVSLAKQTVTLTSDALAKAQQCSDVSSIQSSQSALDKALTELTTAQNAQNGGATQALTSAQSQYRSAQADLTSAQFQGSQQTQGPTATDIQSAQGNITAAQAQLTSAQVDLENAKIIAPVGGYVTAVNAQVGQSIGPGTGFITIASMDPLIATVDVPVDFISKMQVGQPMSVLVPSTQETLEGKISAVIPAPDPTSKKYSVNIALKPGKQQVLPGMPVEAFAQNSGKQGIVIPADCVISMQSGAISVFVVENGKAVSKTVKVGNMTSSVYEITSGLQPGDTLVTVGQTMLSNGNPVQEINSSTTSQSGATGQAAPPSGTQPDQGAQKGAPKS